MDTGKFTAPDRDPSPRLEEALRDFVMQSDSFAKYQIKRPS